MLRANKSVIGLDLGSHSIKAVEVTRQKDRLRITGFGHVEVASEASRPEAIEELFRKSKFQTKTVVSAVSGKAVIVRYQSDMLKMTEEELRNALKFQAEKYFPSGSPIADMELDCQVLGDQPPAREGAAPQMRALLVGVKKSFVEDQAQMLLDLGLTPMVVDVDALAIGNAFELCENLKPTIEPDKAVALLDLGANKTSINILAKGNSQFAREIYIGGNDFTTAIGRGLGLETYEAENLKKSPKDEAELERVLKAIGPVLDDLTNEVKLSFDFFEHQNDLAVDQVLLSGGGSLAPYLETAIERAVERKSKAWSPIQSLELDEDRVDRAALEPLGSMLAVAVGLASRMSGKEGQQ